MDFELLSKISEIEPIAVAGQIRDIQAEEGNLEIVPETNTHGNIKKMPYRDENPIEATRIAKLLAKIAAVYEHD